MEGDITPDDVLDIRGEVCPYPEVESKKKVKKMESGQVLKILVDYPLSAERIPRAMERMGHSVLNVNKVDTEWEILVKVG